MKAHPTAIVHPKAQLADDVEVGPYSIIGQDVVIGAQTKIGSHCVVEGWTTIGRGNRFFTGAIVGTPSQDLKFKEGHNTFLVIGDNNIVREYVTINRAAEEGTKTVIGNGNFIMAYAHIAHNCTLGNDIVIANVGTFAGHVTIEDRATVGGLSGAHQFVRIGTLSIIGGCSKVVQDVPPYSICDGHPARVYSLNMVGLKRAGVDQGVRKSLKAAFKILFNSGLSTQHALKKIEQDVPDCKEVSHLIKFVRSSERGICGTSLREGRAK